jgi:hypothetical protein
MAAVYLFHCGHSLTKEYTLFIDIYRSEIKPSAVTNQTAMVGTCCHLNVPAVVGGMPLEAFRLLNYSLIFYTARRCLNYL